MKFLKVKKVVREEDGFSLECIDKNDAVAIVLFNSDYTKVALVKQFRAGSESEIYELPAGIIEDSEDPYDAIVRETIEETGYEMMDIKELGKYYVSPGYTNEKIHLYTARTIPGKEPKQLNLDENEILNMEWINIEDVKNITIDMKTQFGLERALSLPKKKIGIYGGTFNPITYLHLLTLERAIEEQQLDFCIIEPVGDCYVKDDIIPAKQRLEMLKAGTKSNDKIVIGNFEASKLIQPNTIDTLEYYKQEYGWCEIYFICGSDNLRDMCGGNAWANYVRILSDFNVICIQRDNDNVYQNIILKNKYMLQYKNNIHVIHENVVNNVSASAVRNLVRAGMSIKYIVPEEVEQYIKDNKLYIEQ